MQVKEANKEEFFVLITFLTSETIKVSCHWDNKNKTLKKKNTFLQKMV